MPRQLTQAEGRQGTAAGPVIHVAGEQQQLTLPRMLWPAGCDRGQGAPLFFEKIDKKQANELIAGSEFNILPDPDPKPPHVSIRDLYAAFDEIKAAVKK